MRTWTFDGIFICLNDNPVTEMYLNDDEAQFIVDACNARERMKGYPLVTGGTCVQCAVTHPMIPCPVAPVDG